MKDVLGWIAVIALSLYDIFVGLSISFFHTYLLPIGVFSSLKGIHSLISDVPFGIFFLMGAIDLIAGVTSLLLFFGKDLWFFSLVGIMVLLKGLYCLISSCSK